MRQFFLLTIISFSIFSCELPTADKLILNVEIIDGSGIPAYHGDIAIRGDSIIAIGPDLKYVSEIIIDGEGRVATPGFIDPHSHGNPLSTPDFSNFLTQGITTMVLGQDGSGPTRGNLSDWFDELDKLDLGVNVATLVGHGTLRRKAGVSDNLSPDQGQLAEMNQDLNESLEAGAFGMSTGLEYVPGFYAEEDELISLAKTVGLRDGLIMSHMRNEDNSEVDNSLRELIQQGQYCRVQASHLKVVYGKGRERAEEIINILDSARTSGIDIKADVYPYTASYTGIGIVFPEWARAPFDYQKVKEQRREELREYITMKVSSRNGPESTLFGTAPWAGKTLQQVADSLNIHFADVLIDDIGPSGASAAYFVMDEELQERLLQSEGVMVCTDGSPTMRHPRGYGSFTKIINEYVSEKELFSLETAVSKMTSLAAESLGMKDRGVLRVGAKADILLFNPQKVSDKATFEEPFKLSRGMDYIFLNGELVLEKGQISTSAGKVLRKGY